jgi:SAM-dependent methyltransferase
MTQNIYDDEAFFAAYSRLPRSVGGLDEAPEWPSLRALLPDLRGRRVVDLGCGFGWFCRWARAQGAASVLGIDVSARMLARAKAETADLAISYLKADLEGLRLGEGAFDVAYSALAFHYLEHLDRLLAEIHGALAAGGMLVFSVEHPIYTAPSKPGWIGEGTAKRWPVGGYLDEGVRITDWLAPGVIKRHRTVATYLNGLLSAGFALSRIDEWAPSKEQIAAHPEWADERQRPTFLLVACRRA